MNRWLPVVGGVSMNLALGSLYAWSVFVLPLEQEFGWSRAETSWTFTIAIVTFAASFILAGGFRTCEARGSAQRSAACWWASVSCWPVSRRRCGSFT